MNYTDTDGNPATGVVWSPGPRPGTLWVLPRSGASAGEARCVKLDRKAGVWRQLSTLDIDESKAKAVTTITKPDFGVIRLDRVRHLTGVPADHPDLVRAAHRQAFNDSRGLPAKDWHAALGFVPADVVRRAEAGSALPAAALMLDLGVA